MPSCWTSKKHVAKLFEGLARIQSARERFGLFLAAGVCVWSEQNTHQWIIFIHTGFKSFKIKCGLLYYSNSLTFSYCV